VVLHRKGKESAGESSGGTLLLIWGEVQRIWIKRRLATQSDKPDVILPEEGVRAPKPGLKNPSPSGTVPEQNLRTIKERQPLLALEATIA